jgi:beta-phosphoglucomutase-like phosphatase (HAD superfamily)
MIRNFPKKEIIIFDFDGVIYDSIGLVRNDMYRKYPQLKEEDFLEIFNGNFWKGVQKVKDKYGKPEKYESSSIALEGEIFKGIPEPIQLD